MSSYSSAFVLSDARLSTRRTDERELVPTELSCPQASPLFVASLNMNIDYGFFQLLRALMSLRDN